MLIKDYYRVNNTDVQDGCTVFDVSLNPDCQVYEGHFPGEPISPGVCNVQMIKDLAEEVAGFSLLITNVQLCRFLNLVTPTAVPTASVRISMSELDGKWSLSSSIYSGETEYVSLKAELVRA